MPSPTNNQPLYRICEQPSDCAWSDGYLTTTIECPEGAVVFPCALCIRHGKKKMPTFRERMAGVIAAPQQLYNPPPCKEIVTLVGESELGKPKGGRKKVDIARTIRHGKGVLASQRSANKHIPFDYSLEDWRHALLFFKGCAACGRFHEKGEILEMDHWIPRIHPQCPGTVPGNIVPLCARCNTSKSNVDGSVWAAKRFGKAKGKRIVQRVHKFFKTVRKLDADE